MKKTANIGGHNVEFDEVDLDEAERLQAQGATIIDVREHDERARKHIPGSIHIPMGEIAARIDEVPDGRILIACARGQRSAVVAELVEKTTGRTDVSSVAGGTDGWEAADKPITRG